MSKNKFTLGLLIIGALLAGGIMYTAKMNQQAPVVGSVSLAVSKTVSPSPVWVAHDKGFFRKVGLDAIVKPYSSGKATTEAMLRGEVDLSASAEFLAAQNAYDHKELRIFSTLAFVHQIQFLALKQQGIATLADIRGKRIGVRKGTNGEYFLKRLLTLNGIGKDEVQLVDLKPQAMKDALAEGSVDAVIVWPPFVQQIKSHFGEQLLEFDGQPGQDYYYVILGREDWAQANPLVAEKVMQALVMAENWIVQNPEEAAAYLAGLMVVEVEDMRKILAEYRFSVSLPQSLVIAMESEFNWLEEENLVDRKQRPKLLDMLVSAPLGRVESTRVNILH